MATETKAFNSNMLKDYASALERNNFKVFITASVQEAGKLFFNQILPELKPQTISWGDSLSMKATGIIEQLKQLPEYTLINTSDKSIPLKEQSARKRQALQTDLFITGTNAVTAKGQLVNLDMIGNRVAGITFGPRKVVLFIGKNKLSGTLEDAMNRIKTISAPLNIKRHPQLKTPCQITGICHDCASPNRICNSWVITEKSFPKGRIHVVLINQNLGL